MRKKEEILEALKTDDERSRERERPSYETLQLEVLIDIRDILSGKAKVSEDRSLEESVETKEDKSKS